MSRLLWEIVNIMSSEQNHESFRENAVYCIFNMWLNTREIRSISALFGLPARLITERMHMTAHSNIFLEYSSSVFTWVHDMYCVFVSNGKSLNSGAWVYAYLHCLYMFENPSNFFFILDLCAVVKKKNWSKHCGCKTSEDKYIYPTTVSFKHFNLKSTWIILEGGLM